MGDGSCCVKTEHKESYGPDEVTWTSRVRNLLLKTEVAVHF